MLCCCCFNVYVKPYYQAAFKLSKQNVPVLIADPREPSFIIPNVSRQLIFPENFCFANCSIISHGIESNPAAGKITTPIKQFWNMM